jgi:hypothetical protein
MEKGPCRKAYINQIKVKNNGEKIKETNNEKPVFPFTKSKTPKQKTSIIIAPSFFKRIEL